jgi:hypothetical protein
MRSVKSFRTNYGKLNMYLLHLYAVNLMSLLVEVCVHLVTVLQLIYAKIAD